jgi:hypothetical protein
MMPIISEANQHQNEPEATTTFLASVSLLTAILLIVLILLFKQMKKLKGHKGNVANDQLSALNATLQAINLKLKETNST